MTVQSTLSGLERHMERTKLKDLLIRLKEIVSELESEVYSDTSKYLHLDDKRVRVEDDDGETD